MLNELNMIKWIAALRSGDFKQTTNKLHSDDGCHCCLGVAELIFDIDSADSINKTSSYNHIMDELGIDAEQMNIYITFNDEEYYTFSQIADEAEKLLME